MLSNCFRLSFKYVFANERKREGREREKERDREKRQSEREREINKLKRTDKNR
jgi:hypothetical protein